MKEIKEIAEELWDSHSQRIGSDIDDLHYFADRDVILKSDFEKAIQSFASQQSAGLRWVKASERLPDNPGRYFVKVGRQSLPDNENVNQVATFTSYKEWYLENHHHSGDFFVCYPYEWLDESAPSQSDAVEFAEWVGANQYTKHQVNDRWYDAENFIGTTSELFDLFLHNKKK